MIASKFVTLMWLTSFITTTYCQMDQNERLSSCKYFEKNGRSCNQMKLYRADQLTHSREILTEVDYIVQSENTDVFYMCKDIYYPGYWGKILLTIVSMTFLFIHLIFNFNKGGYFQIRLNQLLYGYSIGLIVMYALFIYIYLQFPVSDIRFNLTKIFWTYHFMWTTLILIVFCFECCCMCKQCENTAERTPLENYLSIFFVLFGFALSISPPIMYLNFLESHANQCPSIPGHSVVTDVSVENVQFIELINITVPLFMFVIVSVGIICFICLLINKWCDYRDTRPVRSRLNSVAVYVKIISFMGINGILWAIHREYEYYENKHLYTTVDSSTNMKIIAQLIIDIHGVLVFFVLLTGCSTINGILNKYGCKPRNATQQGDNGAAETTTTQFMS